MSIPQYINTTFVKLLLISLVAVAVLFYMHHSSYKNSLRYTMIAEGNISIAIGEIWINSLAAFKGIVVKNEAEDSGRIRPAHWFFYQIPFFVTLMRNGDVVANEDGVDMAHRINGDLQTHTIVLLIFISAAVVMMAYVLLEICKSWFSCFLFVIIFSGSLTISQNLLRNYCDSGEIFQLFFISSYVFTIFFVWKCQGVRRYLFEILSVLFLFLAYAIKETVLATLPIAIISLVALYLLNKHNSQRRLMLVRQLGWHIFFSSLLLLLIIHFKSTGYSKNYNAIGLDYYSRVQTAFDSLRLGYDVSYLISISFFSLVIIIALWVWNFISVKKIAALKKRAGECSNGIIFSLIAFAGCFAFIAINIPWQLIISKYFIVSYFFLSLGLASLQSVFLKMFYCFSLKWIAKILVFAVVLFSANELMVASTVINDFYTSEYDGIDSIPVVAKDIAADAYKFGKIKTRIISNPYRDGGLAFLRHINLLHCVNIEQNGKVVSSIYAPERNYFHVKNNVPSAELVLFERLGDYLSKDIDTIYIYDKLYDDEAKKLLEKFDFEEASILDYGSHDVIRKFCRLKNTFIENSQLLLSFDDFKNITSNLKMNNIELHVEKEGCLKIQAIGEDPYMLLPRVNDVGPKGAILRLSLNCPQKTIISLYHSNANDHKYSEKRRYSRPIDAGENELYFFLPFENLNSPLRIDLGETTGTYLLRDLEVRSVTTLAKPTP